MVSMIDKIVAFIFSFLLIALGQILLRKERANLRLTKKARESVRISTKQIIRRIICACLIMAIGILIFIGFLLVNFENRPVTFSIYWGSVFLLVFLLLLLAYGDMKEIIFHFYGKPNVHDPRIKSSENNGSSTDE
jgi:amino acid transporter